MTLYASGTASRAALLSKESLQQPVNRHNKSNLAENLAETHDCHGHDSDKPDTLKDVGHQSQDHYCSRLSPLRYKLRTLCLPLVRWETPVLASFQEKCRTPVLDFYFAWTANLASHTFYVLMLPLPLWFGGSRLARDLIAVLGFGIYVTGFCKDYLCLPRPRSPPLHRITMLSYTTQEYGWPSSHAANATAVSLILCARLFEGPFTKEKAALGVLLVLYYFSLVVGRLYCGMHGFFDILTGLAIGTVMFLFRHFFGETWDQFLLFSHNDSWFGIVSTFVFLFVFHITLIHIYPEPVDDCPCFDDSVAFVGVLLGIDLGHYLNVLTNYQTPHNPWGDPIMVAYSFAELGYLRSFARGVLGIVLVLTWKVVLKPIVFSILPPIYKWVGIYLPRRNYVSTAGSTTLTRQIRSQSLSNMRNEPMGNIRKVLKPSNENDGVGPEGDSDAYEILDYELKHPTEQALNVKLLGVFRKRYDVETMGRTIVYIGVAMTSIWGFALGKDLVGL